MSGSDSGVTFKTDVAAEAGRVAYLEGALTRPDLLGRGVGVRAFSALCRRLLRRYDTLCLLGAADNRCAFDFYRCVGFSPHEPLIVLCYGPRAVAKEAGSLLRAAAAREGVARLSKRASGGEARLHPAVKRLTPFPSD